jgi:hypothetical protein
MDRSLKFVHLVGMALFLGSIAVYLALSPWAKAGSLDRLLFARQVIALGTISVTLPGLWLAVAAGVGLGLLFGHALERAGCASSLWPAC